MNQEALRMLTVYNRPADYPSEVVVRENFVAAGGLKFGEIVWRGYSVSAAEQYCQSQGLYNLGRQLDDVPAIVSTWV